MDICQPANAHKLSESEFTEFKNFQNEDSD